MRTAGAFATFLLFLGLWTWKLLEPNPVPESVARGFSLELKFLLAKGLHAGAYAFLTVLAGLLPIRRPHFWMVVVMLAIHPIGTELGQSFMPPRSGSVRDVLIDWLGIGLGLLVLRLANGVASARRVRDAPNEPRPRGSG
ncbi:MAG: VanZ family protein [Planctomycetia bacterium]|nr:VanZ family protein [Planctomycetia bacterium]